MAIRLGYACIAMDVDGAKMHTCALKNATPDRLAALIDGNLDALENILQYNIANGIRLFRISSEVIPFGSHPVNTLPWAKMFAEKLAALGEIARTNDLRLSMHPGQYTVLNSPSEDVVGRAVADLRYHCDFLDAMQLSAAHKIILHIGGAYGDKTAATARFIRSYRALDDSIRRRLVIENDDRLYTAADVLAISESEGIPVVFDNLHHAVNPDNTRDEAGWIAACAATWQQHDGPQKLHYSQQAADKKAGSHADTLDEAEFLRFYHRLQTPAPDIMLEVKDKNCSAIRCLQLFSSCCSSAPASPDTRSADPPRPTSR